MMCERTLVLLHEEKLDTPLDLGGVHYNAFQMAQAVKDKAKAKHHLRQALHLVALSDGSSSPLIKEYETTLKRL